MCNMEAKEIADDYSLEYTCKVEDIIEDDRITAVVIATPSSSHYELSKLFLENNKDVFVEKPITLKSENAEELVKIAKSKNKKYDALVAVSGGKDSSYALHLCTKVYGLNVLSFTNDHGLRADFADENVLKIVKKLGVDHVRTEEPILMDLYRHLFVKTSHFCSVCELATFNSNFMVAEKYDVPLP